MDVLGKWDKGFGGWAKPFKQKQVQRAPLGHSCSLGNRTCLTSFFLLAFTVAFLFNWIGFFLSFCLTTSAAGRYGAISGFGLSLIKWILIVRVSCASVMIVCREAISRIILNI